MPTRKKKLTKKQIKERNWGGKREGSGRKATGKERVVDTTKVIRVSLKDYDRIKNGRYEELMTLLADYQDRIKNTKGAKTSPRWEQLKKFMNEAEKIFESED